MNIKNEILSRLLKEGSLTLEEALILLDKADNELVMTYQVKGNSVTCTNIQEGSTWNSSCTYAKRDETPTL